MSQLFRTSNVRKAYIDAGVKNIFFFDVTILLVLRAPLILQFEAEFKNTLARIRCINVT